MPNDTRASLLIQVRDRTDQEAWQTFVDVSDSWDAFEQLGTHEECPKTVPKRLGRKIAWVYKAKYRILQRLKSELKYLGEDLPW